MGNSKRDLVIVLYTIVILLMCIFCLTGDARLNSVRYVYTIIMMGVTIRSSYIVKNKSVFVIVGLFVLHTLVFGYCCVPENISSFVHDNAKEQLIFWIFVFTTANYVYRKRLTEQFLYISQMCMALLVDYSYITHFNGIAPIKFLPRLLQGGNNRVRFSFGFTSWNTMAYTAVAAIMLTIIVIRNRRNIGKGIDFYWIFNSMSLLISILVVLSTQSVGAILAVGLYFFVIRMFDTKFRLLNKAFVSQLLKFRALLTVGSLLITYAIYVLRISKSRSYWISLNSRIFNMYSNKLIGLGYTTFTGFLHDVFDYGTGPIDSYYVYILYSTGILGFAMIMIALTYMLFRYVKLYAAGRTDKLDDSIISLFIVILFICFNESSLVLPFESQTYIYWILFLLVFFKSDGVTKKGVR